VSGLADSLRERGIAVVGPNAAGAELEGSKAFAKAVMVAAGVPTARYVVVTERDAAEAALAEFERPPVVKADGLAAGKGVIVPTSFQEAREALDAIMVDRAFGTSGARVVLEECLIGVEASFMVLTDGSRFVALTPSQDHKRIGDGDQGPNTGGMGAFAPTPTVTDSVRRQVEADVIEPTLAELRRRGIDFRGFLYAGLMLTADGPKVLEFNVRAGDPETEAVMFGLDADLVPVLEGVASGSLDPTLKLPASPSATIIMASAGYPASSTKGVAISGIDAADALADVKVFQAGTRPRQGGGVETGGGRVLAVTARAKTLSEAVERGYQGLSKVQFDGAQYRNDIGRQAS